jgi:OmpA-OmpF porin, OOP family
VQTISRRYRQSLGGWWWGAFVGVPLILATIGTNTSSDAAANTSGSTDSLIPAASTPIIAASISLRRLGQTVTITGSFPDEASHQAAVCAIQLTLGNTPQITDRSTIVPGSTGPSPQSMRYLASALTITTDVRVSLDGSTATAAGTVSTAQDEQAVLAAVAAAVPSAEVKNELTVANDCALLANRIKTASGSGQIRFSYGSSDVTSSGNKAIATAAELLKTCPKSRVVVFGYADNSGSDAANQAISKDRAETVASRLREQGVANTISWQGRGSNDPMSSNSTGQGRMANRRATITVAD